jgi:Fe2+ transport system protein B
MKMDENEFLNKIVMEVAERRSNNIDHKLKISKKEIKEFYEEIPLLVKNASYKEDIAVLVDNIIKEKNKEFFTELDKYLDEVIKNRKNPLLPIWIAMGIMFIVQLFLLFS